jgi:hypothetical protein
MANINDIGIPLPGGSGMGILHPKVKNKWMVQFINIGNAGSRDLSMQAVTITRPKITFQDVELHRYNSVAWYAGKHTYEPLAITIQDNYSNGASRIIQSQIERQQKLIGADSGPYLASAPDANTYKFAVKLTQLDGGTQVLEEWNYEGCFIASADYTELDYSSSDPVNIMLSIRFDNAFQVYGATPSSGQALGGNSPR